MGEELKRKAFPFSQLYLGLPLARRGRLGGGGVADSRLDVRVSHQ
jgi:hypothetical protein